MSFRNFVKVVNDTELNIICLEGIGFLAYKPSLSHATELLSKQGYHLTDKEGVKSNYGEVLSVYVSELKRIEFMAVSRLDTVEEVIKLMRGLQYQFMITSNKRFNDFSCLFEFGNNQYRGTHKELLEAVKYSANLALMWGNEMEEAK